MEMKENAMTNQRPWKDSRIILGVTGSIAAYKSIQVARDLTQLGAKVDVVLTKSAQYFAPPLSFEGVTGRPALTDLFSAEGAALHVRLGQDTDALCVAPATADFLSRAAQGRADDLICTTLLATQAPVVICPAMNSQMFAHAQVQANLDHLKSKLGYTIAGPTEGALAAGEADGPGRMIEPWQVVEHLGRALAGTSPLTGKQVLVTAGPTREPVDPVRYIGNRSSGRMGYAIAQAAWRRGAEVYLVSGPSWMEPPVGVHLISVETALEMYDAVNHALPEMDVSVFAAAVADFRPDNPDDEKLKRADTEGGFAVSLTGNPDVAGDTVSRRKPGSVAVGFALETSDLIKNAEQKLIAKSFDLLVANDATDEGSGFDVPTNRVTILSPERDPEEIPLMLKPSVAEVIIDRICDRLADVL
jgi:phosphopantothenoylcysteine decarboxylase/phosphopantothenate--cysteine ligase|tara:strand:+ start:6059 stop:7306 length:1248 start_codon:yes stop_codon:yes gene_type:complete